MPLENILNLLDALRDPAPFLITALFIFGIFFILFYRYPKFITNILKRNYDDLINEGDLTRCFNLGKAMVAIACMLFIIYIGANWLVNPNDSAQSIDLNGDYVRNITIDKNYHHIGDYNNSNLFPEAPNYEGSFYIKHFNLPYKTDNLYLSIKTRDVDPDINRGPAIIYINGKLCCYLNSYVEIERRIDDKGNFVDNFAPIEIKMEPNLFNIGENSIIIMVGEGKEKMLFLDEKRLYELELANKDDIEFWDLEIKIIGKK